MPDFFAATNGDELFVNDTTEDRSSDGEAILQGDPRAAIELITSLGSTKFLTEQHLEAANILFERNVCLSPYTIMKTPIHKGICRHFNTLSEIGSELREALESNGAFAFVKQIKQVGHAEGTIERILTVFSMSTSGLWDLSCASPDFVHCVVDIFRSPTGTDWNRDLVGNNPLTFQCLSNIIIGLSSIFDDRSLLLKSRKYRSKTGGKHSGWPAFSYSKFSPDRELVDFYNALVTYSKMKPRIAQHTLIHLAAWLRQSRPGKTLREVVATKPSGSTFTEFLAANNGGKLHRNMISTVGAARIISAEIIDWYNASGIQDQLVYLVPEREYHALVNSMARLPKPSSSRSRPLPEKFIPIMREILEGGPKDWVQRIANFQVDILIDERKVKRYCPVIPTLLLAMLEVPLRMIQLRRLDSGEGDVAQFNGETLSWERNDGPHSGHWAKLENLPEIECKTRGYACKLDGEGKSITGIFVNTNKTGSPYIIPWFNPRLMRLFWDLRRWQETYNPIPKPVGPGVYLDTCHDYSESTLGTMPYIFPLARLFPTANRPTFGRTATSSEINHAWCALLVQIQHRWNDQHPGNPVRLIEINPRNGQPHKPAYNLHGFRVRGLTNLHRGGMPLELVSKLVAGHATLSMTLYYVNRDPIEVADIIDAAISKSSTEQRAFIDDLRRMDIEEARQKTVSISRDAIEEAISSKSQVQFCNVAIGICPFDGTRCSDGGSLRAAADKGGGRRAVYGPVEPHACIMCRHFISGPPWLNELAQYGTKLCEQRQHLAQEQARIDETVFALESMMRAGKIERAVFENKFDELQAEMCQVKDRQEVVEDSIFNVELLCNSSIKLLDSRPEGQNEVLLVANSRSSFVEYDEISEFEQAVRITAAGRIHKILGDKRVEDKRDRFLDLMLVHSSIVPPRLMTNISAEHCRQAMDQYALFVLSRAAPQDVKALTDGTLRLRDIGLEEDVRKLLDVSLSSPIHLHGSGIAHLITNSGRGKK